MKPFETDLLLPVHPWWCCRGC